MSHNDAARTTAPIDYAAPTGAQRRRRTATRVWAAFLLACVIGGLLGTHKRVLRAYDAQRAKWRMVDLQQQCMTWSRPADLVLFEEDHDRLPALIAEGGDRVTLHDVLSSNVPIATWSPCRPWEALKSAMTNTLAPYYGEPVVFSHARTSPTGNRRLVVVTLTIIRQGCVVGPTREARLYPYTVVPGSKSAQFRAARRSPQTDWRYH